MSHQPHSPVEGNNEETPKLSDQEKEVLRKAKELVDLYGVGILGDKYTVADQIHQGIGEENEEDASEESYEILEQAAIIVEKIGGVLETSTMRWTPKGIKIMGRGKKAVDAEKNDEGSSSDSTKNTTI